MQLILSLILFFVSVSFADVSDRLLDAIEKVESGNEAYPKGYNDGGKAKGWYQCHEKYWIDGCRILKVNWNYTDAHDRIKARKITTAYLNHYGKLYTKITGKEPTEKIYAKIHNGGPYGWKIQNDDYWNRIRRAMK